MCSSAGRLATSATVAVSDQIIDPVDQRQLARFIEALDHRRRQLEVQRGDIDALLDEIGAIERDCRRRLKEAGPARPAAPRGRVAATPVRGSDG